LRKSKSSKGDRDGRISALGADVAVLNVAAALWCTAAQAQSGPPAGEVVMATAAGSAPDVIAGSSRPVHTGGPAVVILQPAGAAV